MRFITPRGTCIAHEMILDTVNASSKDEFVKYLNSE